MSYEPAYPEGSLVTIASTDELERFRDSWHFHHKLDLEQLQYGSQTARVKSIGYYHGGDVLYKLEGIPGIWHEACLRR